MALLSVYTVANVVVSVITTFIFLEPLVGYWLGCRVLARVLRVRVVGLEGQGVLVLVWVWVWVWVWV